MCWQNHIGNLRINGLQNTKKPSFIPNEELLCQKRGKRMPVSEKSGVMIGRTRSHQLEWICSCIYRLCPSYLHIDIHFTNYKTRNIVHLEIFNN